MTEKNHQHTQANTTHAKIMLDRLNIFFEQQWMQKLFDSLFMALVLASTYFLFKIVENSVQMMNLAYQIIVEGSKHLR